MCDSTLTGMLSLSYSLRLSKNFISPKSRLDGPQKSSTFFPDPEGSLTRSGLISLITQTADITSLIPEGGFFIVLTIVMSEGLSVLRAARAASRAGIASARSPSHCTCVCVGGGGGGGGYKIVYTLVHKHTPIQLNLI